MTRDEYLINLEKELQDPLKVIVFEDEFPAEHDFPFTVEISRNVGSMSQRELFVLKNVMWTWKGLEDIPPADSDTRLLVAALYNAGKGNARFKFRKNLTRGSAQDYEKFYFSDLRPMSLDQAFHKTMDHLKLVIEKAPDTFFGRWVVNQLTGKSTAARLADTATLQTSRAYTLQARPYGLPLGRASDQSVVFYAGNRSLVTIAPPESGKTMSQALPALQTFGGHVFVLDIKGHLHEKTAARREQAFNSRIINFNPSNTLGAHYNPLLLVSDDPDECYGEADILAQLILPVRNEKDASWETMGQRLLAVFIAYTVLTVTKPEQRSMSSVLNLVAGIGTAEAMTLILSETSLFPNSMKRAANTVLKVMDDRSHAQFTGILQALDTNLSVWNKSHVERTGDRCDWLPEDFLADKPVSLYLTIPPGELSAYAPLIRVIVAQHVFQLMKKIPGPDVIPVLFLLDEFPQLGKMDPIRKAIEVGREYGIKTWLFAQFTRQFEETYGQAGQGLIDICGVRMFMNPPFKDAEVISKESGSRTDMLSEKKQPNMSTEEIMGPANRDSVFVLSSNETPLVLSKNFPPREMNSA